MLDLTSKALPDTITVDGRAYLLNTDFRVWLRFFRDVKECERKRSLFNASYLFKDAMPVYIDVNMLMQWAIPPRELPRPIGDECEDIVLDYDIDSDLIYSAFMEQYGIDLMDVEMHWYKFMALIRGISSETMLGKVIGWRSYEKDSRSLDEIKREMKHAWEIIEPLTPEEQAETDAFDALFD